MRRITVVGMIILGLVALPLIAAATPAPDKKVEICHSTGDGAQTIEVSMKAKAAHLAHGDEAGLCPDTAGAELPVLTAEFVGSVTCGTGFFSMRCDLALDSSGSSGDIASYEWTYAITGDGTGIAYGPTATFENLTKGTTAEVTLIVTSTAGDSISTTQFIQIFGSTP